MVLALVLGYLPFGHAVYAGRPGDDITALQQAVRAGDTQRVSFLLAEGADPDVANRLGDSALHIAAARHPPISKQLIDTGATLDLRNAGGVTPLMFAAGAGRSGVVGLLLGAGARADFRDYQGKSAADWARDHGHQKLATQLAARETAAQHADEQRSAEGADGGDPFAFAEDVFVDVQFPPWFKESFLDLRDDLDEAREAGKQGLMLFISTRRCSYCEAFIHKSLQRPDIRQRVQQRYQVIGLEIFDDTEMVDPDGTSYRVKEFVKVQKASFTPTLIFYDLDGRQRLKLVGYYPPEDFSRVLDYLAEKPEGRDSLRAYLAARRAAERGQAQALPQSPQPRPVKADQALFEPAPHLLDRRAGPAVKPLLVVFERPECDACERFHDRVLADPAVRRLIPQYEAVQLDVTAKTAVLTPGGRHLSAAQWFDELGLNYYPAVLFFSESGTEVLRLDSETQRFRMLGSLQLVLEKGYQNEAQLQKWRKRKAIAASRLHGG